MPDETKMQMKMISSVHTTVCKALKSEIVASSLKSVSQYFCVRCLLSPDWEHGSAKVKTISLFKNRRVRYVKNKGSYEPTPFWVLYPLKYKNINITIPSKWENILRKNWLFS